jgi:hypothetical protein
LRSFSGPTLVFQSICSSKNDTVLVTRTAGFFSRAATASGAT